MIKHSMYLPLLLLIAACGYRAGEYEPVLLAGAQQLPGWGDDLAVCHSEAEKAGSGRAGYGPAFDVCMENKGHDIDRAASAAKFAEIEKERKRKDAETVKKAGGYHKPD